VRARPWPALVAAAALLCAGAPRAVAHLVYGTTTLSRLVAESDLVVRGRVLESGTLFGSEAATRPGVRIEVAETLKGVAPAPEAGAERPVLAFAQHGHGVAEHAPGEQVVVFLRPIERSRELDALAASGLRFVSVQEHDEKLLLGGPQDEALLAALRAYVALESSGTPQERQAAFRGLTLELVASPVPRLASSALRDLLGLGDALAIGPKQAQRLAALVASPSTPIGVRVGLLAELERRGLVDAAPGWAALAREARGADRVAAIHAAGAHPSPAVTEALVARLRGDDAAAAEAAAVALGSPGNDAAVPALAQALAEGPPRLRGTAIRGLAGVATPAARAALAQAAAEHPDPQVRRRAAGEIEKQLGSLDAR
jgi:HEAT repeat protein